MKQIPDEVMWVWAMEGKAVGKTIYDKIVDVMDRYPEYFQWEHKYNSIPKEVHEAYHLERYGDSVECGLRSLISNQTVSKFSEIKDFEQMLMEREKAKAVEKKRVKSIWDKHYSKYGLEYRGKN